MDGLEAPRGYRWGRVLLLVALALAEGGAPALGSKRLEAGEQAAPGTPAPPPAAPQAEPAGPCASAAALAAGAMRKMPAAMPSWPLYEAELTIEPKTGRVDGRLRITVPVDHRGPVRLVLPLEAGSDVSPIEWRAATLRRGSGAPQAGHLEPGLGRISFGPIPAGEGPAVISMRLQASLPRLGPASVLDALSSIQPGSSPALLGGLVVHDDGVTLQVAYPYLLSSDAAAVPPAPWGAPLPGPPACHLVRVDVPRGYRVVASGHRVGRIPAGGGRVHYAFAAAGARRFSLLVLSKEMASVETRWKGVHLRATAHAPDQAHRLLRWAKGALEVLEGEWGAYPYTDLQVAAIPLSGAVDGLRGPGVVAVSSVFEDPQATDLFTQAALADPTYGGATLEELVLVHQVAHQWAGEVVATPGPAQPVLEEVIANEGLLRYAADRYGARAAKAVVDKVFARLYQTWRALGSEDAPADRPYAELGFGGWVALCGGKASALLPFAEGAFGPRRVRTAVARWLREGRFATRDRASLEAAMASAVAPTDRPTVRALFAHHLDERHGDADLGVADFGALLGPRGLSPGATPGPGGLPPGIGSGGVDPAALQRMMEEMIRALQGGP